MDTTHLPTTTDHAVITGPKAFHRQGRYQNWLHNLFSIFLPILGLAAVISALVLTIVGTAKVGRNDVDIVDAGTGSLLFDPNRYNALWIIDAALLPVVLVSGILSIIFSRLAMRYEKNLAKYNNDASTSQQNKRRASVAARWAVLIPCFLNELLQLALIGFFIATVVMSAMRFERWRTVKNFYVGCPPQTTTGQCNGIGRGFSEIVAGTILSLCSVLPFLILNSMALSHLGSRENKSDKFPAQQATAVVTSHHAVPAASTY